MSDFDYESYDGAYQHRALNEGSPVQQFWHRMRWQLALQSNLADSESVVVDIGCGSGNGAFYFAGVAKQVIGLDVSKNSLSFCRDYQNKNKIKNIKFMQIGFKGEIPLRDQSVDCALCSEVIEHLPEIVLEHLLLEVFRILKPGGFFWVTTPNYLSLWPVLEKTLDLLKLVPPLQEQHVQYFHTRKLISELTRKGFQINGFGSMYLISPFLTLISETIATKVFSWELRQGFLPKMITYARCQKRSE